jgi:ADP-ribosyl-[dinitrogen reductase] hydrolase
VDDRARRQRALGAVIGSAVGDALGAPFEFRGPGEYKSRSPTPVLTGMGEMIGGGAFKWDPAEFTDDTQMAIVQAESILRNGGFEGTDLFGAFQQWAASAEDVGIQTRAVLSSGLSEDEAAKAHYAANPRNAAGNGSLMRATPTAVWAAVLTDEETVELARATSAVTHGDPAAGWGAALYHLMIKAALEGRSPWPALEQALDTLPDDQNRYRRMLATDWHPRDSEVSNKSVWGCLAFAVWAVRSTTNFSDAVTTAVNLGDDADTVGAVAGGLAGAMYGIQSIPSRWTTYLHGRVGSSAGTKVHRLADLQELTSRLLGEDAAPETPLGPRQGPIEIAPGLYAADLGAAADAPRDWAIVSLCRTAGHFIDHPDRRELYLIDRGADHNLDLHAAVSDAVDTIDAYLETGQTVLVHCHGGASRTGLILRAWLMRHRGGDEEQATRHLGERWPALGLWNEDFTQFLRTNWCED